MIHLLALLTGFSPAHAAERSLSCHLSLPANQELALEARLEEGKARIQHEYKFEPAGGGAPTTFEIDAQVWGFQEGAPGRKAGYLSINRVPEKIDAPRNYAINHCERKSARDGCPLELVTVLEGVGMRVTCDLPAL